MAVFKRLIKSSLVQALGSHLFFFYTWLVLTTARIEKHHDKAASPYVSGEKNAIFIFWHGRMLLLPRLIPQSRKMRVLISFHRDGRLIANILKRFNMDTVHGSSSRGGANAVKTLVKYLQAGDNAGITPDGPRGPAEKMKKGALNIAKHAEKPLIPVSISAAHCKRLGSWDRFMLIYPFSRIVFCVGAPIDVSTELEHCSNDQVQAMIQDAMDRLTQQSDALAAGNGGKA